MTWASSEQPGGQAFDDAFDDVLPQVDGYLCELKDAQIRGGLHVLGQPPGGDALIDTVLAATRLPQGQVPSLRATVAERLGPDVVAGLANSDRHTTDAVEAECRRLVAAAAERNWRARPGRSADPGLDL